MFVIEIDKNFQTELKETRNSEIEFILVTSGYLVCKCNFNSIRINPKEVHLSISQQSMSIIEKSENLQAWYCRFDKSFLDQIYIKENLENEIELISSFLYQYPLRLNDSVFQRLISNFNFISQIANSQKSSLTLLHAYLVACIYEIKKVLDENHLDFYPAKAFSITKSYSDLLNLHIEKEQCIEFYAKALSITPNHLNKSVKSVTGKTAIMLLNEIRLMEVKYQLKQSDLPVSEVAYRFGFEDQSYFSRFFKKQTGFSPIDFRKNNK